MLTSVPTGRPDFEAFVQQNPEWWLTEGQEQYYPKTLFLSVERERITADLYDLFEQLLDEGFEIYKYMDFDDPKIECVRKESIYKLLSDCSFYDDETIINEMATYNKCADEILIIDRAKLEKLRIEVTKAITNTDGSGPGCIEIAFNWETDVRHYKTRNLKHLSHIDVSLGSEGFNEYKQLYNDVRSVVSISWGMSSLNENFDDIDNTLSLRKLCLSQFSNLRSPSFKNYLARLVKLNSFSIKLDGVNQDVPYTLRISDFPEGFFTKLQEITLAICEEAECFDILHETRNAISICLEDVNKNNLVVGVPIFPNSHFDSLEELRLAGGLSMRLVLAILQQAKNIKRIQLLAFPSFEDLLGCEEFQKYYHLLTLESVDRVEEYKECQAARHSEDLRYNDPQGGPPSIRRYISSGEEDIGYNKQDYISDADTGRGIGPDDIPEFKVKRLFYAREGQPHPAPNLYRINVYNNLNLNSKPCSPDNAFKLTRNPLRLVSCKQPTWVNSPYELIEERDSYQVPDRECYFVPHIMDLSSEWSPLPSWSAHEIISKIFVQGLEETDLEFQYNLEDNLYYVRSKKAVSKANVYYTIHFPTTQATLPPAIQELVDHYRSFGRKALLVEPNRKYTGREYLNLVDMQNVGACRHRSKAFKRAMGYSFPQIPVRIPNNKIHEFAEVYINNIWTKICLGGYPAKLTISDVPEPTAIQGTTLKSDHPHSTLATEDDFEFDPQFVTWETKSFDDITQEEFNSKLIREAQKVLCNLPDGSTKAYSLCLQQHCLKQNRPVYYVHSPKDLICSANWIERAEDNTGTLRQGPGGLLYQFLTENEENAPVIIVNWNHFKYVDIAQFNSILDDERLIDGCEVPETATIIGLYDLNAESAYDGSDFLQRFDKNYDAPDSIVKLATPDLISNTFVENDSDKNDYIDLYDSFNWKSLLLGRWVMQGKKMFFHEGPLLKAWKEHRPIHLKNAPWKDEAFELFWNQALLHQQKEVAGKKYDIDKSVKYTKSVGYDWEQLNSVFNWLPIDSKTSPIYILNPTTWGNFFYTYRFESDQCYEEAGWLEQNAGKILSVDISRNLSHSQLIQLITKAIQYNVTLHFHPKAGLTLPEGMKAPSEVAPPLSGSQIIVSSDPDYTVSKQGNAIVFDISELKSSDVVLFQDVDWEEDNINFKFEEKISDVYSALQAGERVILKGHFSNQLADVLSSLITHNAYLPDTLNKDDKFGELIIVSENEEPFILASHDTICVTPEQKRQSLVLKFGAFLVNRCEAYIESDSYTKLNTRLEYLRDNPNSHPDDCWHGFTHLRPEYSTFSLGEMDLSLEACELFEANRIAQFEASIRNKHYVFIAGVTGVGKSTFIDSTLKKTGEYKIFNEEIEAEEWARPIKNGKKHVLFIDEANVGSSNYSRYEGLFDKPPSIMIGNKRLFISDDHIVVFAGNPLSYGGERHLPSLFDRHANSIVFTPMPPSYIYHKNLKPLFNSKIDEFTEFQLTCVFLRIYQHVLALHSESVLMSPRELEMMVVTLMSQHPYASKESMMEKAYEIGYSIAISVLPKSSHTAFDSAFNQEFFNPTIFSSTRDIPANIGDFILTPSRYKAYRQFKDFLQVREYQKNAPDEATQFAGLGGFVFEGEPGTGKSLFAVQMLIAQGYREGIDFYRIPASMSNRDKRRLLLKAFHEGAMVCIDEINSCRMLEKLMNRLMMGRDLQGNRPLRPGFKVIGTQNPIHYKGRKAKSVAEQRRFVRCEFSEYPYNELVAIIIKKGIKPTQAKQLAYRYLKTRDYAIKHRKKRIPTFRKLMKVVERIVSKAANAEVEPSMVQPVLYSLSSNLSASTTKRSERDFDDDYGKPLSKRSRH